MKKFLFVLYGVLIGLLAAGVIWLAATQPRGENVILLPTPTISSVAVYVSGAVVSPGLYFLPEGSRVGDAINAAGGFAITAQQNQINLAAMVEDGTQIDVPGVGITSHLTFGRVNINTATVEELNTLPGIGETTAQSIVDYRTENGPFLTIQDIQNVPGIGPSTYAQIKDLITVEP